MDGFDFYISSNGYLEIPNSQISYLIDFSQSELPFMPQVTDTTVTLPGRDGDIVLSSRYEPISFTIVCYTDENLTAAGKINQERKLRSFLNSIKKNTKTFMIERESKFYDVKYSGNLITTRYPKCVKFSIPLKTSKSYAKNVVQTTLEGEGTVQSNTVEDTGAIISILGPATHPEISFNGVNMYYDNSVLEGNRLEIDTGNSTITHINGTTGVRTNAMPYYNHRFPKVVNGDNTLAINSGIENDSQVSLSFYDLKF